MLEVKSIKSKVERLRSKVEKIGIFSSFSFIVTFIILFLFSLSVSAQQFYPVQVRATVLSPSVFVEDYKDPNNFRVQVTLTDLTITSLDVILKVKFKSDDQGQGFESVIGMPLTLAGGATYTLNRTDLNNLLSANDLSGLPASIPEGTYSISFTALEQNTGVVVSNALTDFTIVQVELLNPPLLTYPEKGKVLNPEFEASNFMFSWTPSSFSLNPQVQVKYRIKFAQVPAGRNPYDALLTNAFNINQNLDGLVFNNFNYDPSLFALQPGFTYAWQVEAYEEKLVNGVLSEVTNRFRNQGRSDVFTFSVKEYCPQLFINDTELTSNQLSGKREVKLSWNDDSKFELFEVKYRPQGSIQNWVVMQTKDDSLHISEDFLVKGKTYEYFVKAKCTGWQDAVYGGTFMLPSSNCEAPEPIMVSSNDEKGIALGWEKIPSANSYTLTYTNNNTGERKTEEGLTEESYLLAPITQGSYTIRLDGICGDVSAQGEEMELAYDEKHFPGECPVPSPFLFLAKRPDTVTTSLYAELSWPSMDLHESFSITYWNSLDTIPAPETLSSTDPKVLAADIATGEFYQYTLEFTCVGGKKTTTPIGGFRVEGGGINQTLSPPTADCFPPAIHSAETRNETSARIDWKGVSGAEEYMVLYYKEGEPENEQVFMTTAANARLTDLEPNATYHYKIRCRCNGEYSIDSDPGKFDLTESYSNNKCDSISDLKVNQVTETEIQLSWTYPQLVKENYDEQSAFTILYKENGQVWDDAYTVDFHLDDSLKTMYADMGMVKKTIDQLSSGTMYDIEVTARCGTEEAKNNDPLSATTKEIQEPDCGSGGACDRTITEPITSSKEEIDTIAIADYLVQVHTIEEDPRGANLWRGTGRAETPMIGFSEHVSFDVTFDSVFINNVACVVEGNVDLKITASILNDEQREQLEELMAQTEQAIKTAQSLSDQASDLIDKGQEYGEKAFNYFHGGDDVGRAKTGGLGETAVSSSALNSISVGGDAVTIGGTSYPKSELPKLFKEDGSNKVYSVGPDGSKTEVGHYDESLLADMDSIPSLDRKLTFKANANARYAFDGFQEAYKGSIAMLPHYLRLDTTYCAAKAITPGATDLVDFDLSSGDADKLTFINRKGFVFNLQGSSTLQLAGGPAADAQEVLALYDNGRKKELVGALLLASYPRLEKKVVLVTLRVGDALDNKVAGIQEQLKKAYNPIGINYTVEVDKSFDQNSDWCETGDCAFSTSGSGALSNDYTGTEARIRDAYVNLKAEELEAETAYLFALGITNPNPGEEALEGKMNFEKQFGFLYAVVQQQSAKTGRILAHELAHGNYKLHHIFEKMYLGEAARNSNNLLSYNSSTEALALNKVQWDVIHDPGVTWGIFKRDEDQEGLFKSKKEKFCEIVNRITLNINNGGDFNAVAVNSVNVECANFIRDNELISYPVFIDWEKTNPHLDQDQITWHNWYIYRLFCNDITVRIHYLDDQENDYSFYKEHPIDDLYTRRYNRADYSIWISAKSGLEGFQVIRNDGNLDHELTGIGIGAKATNENIKDGLDCALATVLRKVTERHEKNLAYGTDEDCWDGTVARFAPLVNISISSGLVSEDGESINITANLSEPTDENVTLILEFEGQAIKGNDFNVPSEIVIPAGSNSASITLTTVRDANVENDETIIIFIKDIKGRAIEEGNQEQNLIIKEVPLATLAEIFNVRTYVDLSGKVKVTWASTGNINLFSWKVEGGSFTDISPSCIDGKCEAVVNVSREIEISYNIKTQDRISDRGFAEIFSKSGDFQGNDCIECLCNLETGRIGKEGQDLTKYSYEWREKDNSPIPELLDNINKPSFDFEYDGVKTYILKRIHLSSGIIDEAEVLIKPLLNCTWFLLAKDNTPEYGGVREAKNGHVLQVVERDKNFKNGIDASIEITDPGPENKYIKGEPEWKLDNIVVSPENEPKMLYYNLKNDYLVNQGANPDEPNPNPDNNFVEVKALKRTESVTIEYFKENRVKVRHLEQVGVVELTNAVNSGWCDDMSKIEEGINQWLEQTIGTDVFNITFPIGCRTEVDIERFNAEKRNSPLVVRDQKGKVSNIYYCLSELCGRAIPLPLTFCITFSGIGGSSVYEFDEQKRFGGPVKVVNNSFKIGTDIVLCMGCTLPAQGCANVPLEISINQPSSLPGCETDIQVAVKRPPNWDGDGDNSNDNDIIFTGEVGGISTEIYRKPGGATTSRICLY